MKNSSGVHGPVVDQCDQCTRKRKVEPYAWEICPAYADPEGKWSNGVCNHADIPKEKETDVLKRAKKAMTQKASEKAARGSLHLRRYKHERAHSKKRYVENLEGAGVVKKGGKKR